MDTERSILYPKLYRVARGHSHYSVRKTGLDGFRRKAARGLRPRKVEIKWSYRPSKKCAKKHSFTNL